MEESFDLAIIGAGPGGYVAAIRAAQLGMKTALIEKEKTLGGTCLNVGCIPSKALLHSSEMYTTFANHGEELGIDGTCKLNFLQMMKRKEKIVEGLVQGVAGLIKKNKVHHISGTASFLSPNELDVSGKKIEAKKILLATGSEPISLPFLPFDEDRIVSSTGALSLKEVPKEMLLIGAGVIGVELASVYSRLGAKVTVVELLDRICLGMDLDLSQEFQKILQKQGLEFHLGAKVLSGEVGKTKSSIEFEQKGKKHTLSGDVILIGIGRRPYSQGLGLEKVGITLDKRGFVPVNGAFQTSVPNIYAIGDLIEGPMLAHRASEEAITVVETMAGISSKVNYMAIPSVVYTSPEVASVGLTEEEVAEAGLTLFKGKAYFRGNARARCGHEQEGMVKVLGEKISGRLVGLHIVGPAASEMIGEGVVVLEKKGTVKELAYASHAHPTLSEAIKEAALAALGQPLHQ